MNWRNATTSAAVMLLPLLAWGQAVHRPPLPPAVPPAAGAPQAEQQGVMQPPPGMPQAKMQPIPYEEYLKMYYKVWKIPKKDVHFVGTHRVTPNKVLRVVLEVVGEDGDDYLVRNLPPDDPQAVGYQSWVMRQRNEASLVAKKEYLKDKFLLVDETPFPPAFTDKVRFVAADKGLPKGGRWQISFDVADMNGDGLPDLVFGPMRTAQKLVPHIFIQRKDHSWEEAAATWPTQGIKLDYGSVRVADFDGDGNEDIAIACHFAKTYVLYGDGKGNFTRFVEVPQTNPDMTARALTVGDFNGDGRPDIATLAELDLNLANATQMGSGLVNVALNLPGGWKAVGKDSFGSALMGDGLAAADLLGNGRADLALTSHSANVMDVVYRNLGGGERWEPVGSAQQPVNSYILANAVGPLDRFKQPDLLECFEQHNPWKAAPATQACVIYRFHDAEGKPTATPARTVLFQERSDTYDYKAAAIGDIDGDGRDDIVVATNNGRVRVFLQGLDGQFYEQRNAGLDQPGTDIFDVRIADLYHDGKGEVILAGSPADQRGGGVWVFRPVAPAAAAEPSAPPAAVKAP